VIFISGRFAILIRLFLESPPTLTLKREVVNLVFTQAEVRGNFFLSCGTLFNTIIGGDYSDISFIDRKNTVTHHTRNIVNGFFDL
jgi:hypothetical protein